MKFYCGLHQPGDAKHFARAFVSVNRVRHRKSPVQCEDWIMDSGAFTQINKFGTFVMSVDEYADVIGRMRPSLAVSQDWMCEPWILERTGLSVQDHQMLSVGGYDDLLRRSPVQVMPVLQGYSPAEYVQHVGMYGRRLEQGMWVGVGSVCKRNASPSSVSAILRAVKAARPDLRLHGFGLKVTALQLADVRDLLYSADSMAWSYAARMNGGRQNDWREARRFVDRIENQMVQESLCL